ncbi:MAG: ABC transporter substrate-binding protein [Candidatus Bipolaricaulota bacterium]
MHRNRYLTFFLVFLLSFLIVPGLVTLAAQDSDGDGVPDAEDQYPGRNDLKYGGTLTLIRAEEPTSLDSLRTPFGDQIHQYISEPALMWSPGGEFGPAGWVESFEQSEDETTLTFHLREGVTFHDGADLDAEAFAWLLRERMRDDSIFSMPLGNVPDTDHIKILDDYTVQIEQSKPWPELPYNMSTPAWVGAMETPRALEKYGEDYGYSEVYGNGPFEFKEWAKRDHITLTRYEEYDWAPDWAWKYSDAESKEDYTSGPPFLEKVVFEYVPEASTRVNMLKSGGADGIIEVPKSQVKDLEQMDNVEIMSQSSYRIRYVGYNTTVAPLDELKVRKALNYATNRKAMVQVVYFGYADPAYSLYCGKDLETSNTKLLYKFDPTKAQELLEEAGWEDSNGDGIRDKDGEKLSFELMTRNTREFRQMANMLQAMWRNIGIEAEVRLLDTATVRSSMEEGDHEAVIHEHQWVTKQDMYPWWFNPDYKPYPYESLLETEKIHELNEKAMAASNLDEMKKTIDDLVNYYYEEAALGALVRPQNLLAVKDNVKNVVPAHKNGGNWFWTPYLYDVYLQDVYEQNKAKAQN